MSDSSQAVMPKGEASSVPSWASKHLLDSTNNNHSRCVFLETYCILCLSSCSMSTTTLSFRKDTTSTTVAPSPLAHPTPVAAAAAAAGHHPSASAVAAAAAGRSEALGTLLHGELRQPDGPASPRAFSSAGRRVCRALARLRQARPDCRAWF